MNRIASIFFLAVALAGVSARADALPAAPIPSAKFELVQYRLGQMCMTRSGACRIKPRPMNTQCYCGRVPGIVR